MRLNELRDAVYTNAQVHGFYDGERYIDVLPSDLINKESVKNAFFAQRIALIHSEVSEALEAHRKKKFASLNVFLNELRHGKFDSKKFEILIKNTVEDELADSLIRILDLCGYMNIDIEKFVKLKMQYNESREYKHGKAY